MKKTDVKWTPIYVSFPPGMLERVDARVKEQMCHRSEYIRRLIAADLENAK